MHPGAGELHLLYETMQIADHEHRLGAWLPADDATAAAVQTIVSVHGPVSPAVLRVVGER